MDTYTTLSRRVKHLEIDKIAQALEITKLKRRVKKLERGNKVKVLKLIRLQKVGTTQRVKTFDETMMDDVSNQGRMIAEMDQDADVVLEDAKEVADDAKDVLSKQEDETKPAKVQEIVDVVTTAKLITKVVTAASESITAASITIANVEAQVLAVTLTAAPSRVIAAPSRRRKGVVIRDPQEESTTSAITPAETKSKDKGKGIFVEEPKPLKKQAQIEQDEQYARELETKEQIEEEESRALKRLNETPAEKAAKRQKLEEENNKHYYKIIRADGTHQLYVSFLSLLRNFDREDLEALRSLVKEIFSTTKPKNFCDDFLLITLGAMFEKPDIHAQI
nr:hypothetical protein [Tanacetum cinerariifolium]